MVRHRRLGKKQGCIITTHAADRSNCGGGGLAGGLDSQEIDGVFLHRSAASWPARQQDAEVSAAVSSKILFQSEESNGCRHGRGCINVQIKRALETSIRFHSSGMAPPTRIERVTLPLGVSFWAFPPSFTKIYFSIYIYTNHGLTGIVEFMTLHQNAPDFR